jgi:hypothetical protein
VSTSRRVCRPASRRREAVKQQIHHVSAELLGLHVLGDLPIFQRFHVEEHLSTCGTCRDHLRHVAGVIVAFRTEA